MKTITIKLACDMGGTRIKLGLVRGVRLIGKTELDARAHEGLGAALSRVARAARKLYREAGVVPRELVGFGLSFPGIIEPRAERILSTPAGKFDDAKGTDVPVVVQRLLGLRTVVCNDANAALAGEWRFGAARGFRSAVMMTLGTGIGSSAIIDSVPLRGSHGQAGCMGGHTVVNVDGHLCRCGNLGCAETEASTWALPLLAKARPGFRASQLARERTLDYAAVFRAAAQGDALARELRNRAVRVWAGALVTLIHSYDPEVAVIGGGIMRSRDFILPRLRRFVAHHAWTPWGRVRIKPATLGNDAGMLGAACLVDERE